MRVTAPSWRFDLEIEEDFVEEIARIHGYEHVPDRRPRASVPMLPLAEASAAASTCATCSPRSATRRS
jgi:phenylalanyl-tRNA synthetase beta chain